MNPIDQFKHEVRRNIEAQGQDEELKSLSRTWLRDIARHNYAYNFTWLGRPIIQIPQDMAAMQELVWSVRPDLIIETGIAHGGSLILNASLLALLDHCDAIAAGPERARQPINRRVVGIDIDIRAHNRSAIESHPLAGYIEMIQGSSIDASVVDHVRALAGGYSKIMVVLDSNHTHEHVLAELEAYAPLTSQGSYCVVFDTLVEDMPDSMFPNRPWGKGNNPKTAVWKYLELLETQGRTAMDGGKLKLEIDRSVEDKLLLTVAPDGYLKRT